MTEKQAKKQLAKMLTSFTPGSILHLLGDMYRQLAEEARQADDPVAYEKAKLVEYTLIVVGLGIDAANPR